jgi:hypothetical protein
VAQAALRTALRDVERSAAEGLPEAWRTQLQSVVSVDHITEELDAAVASTDLQTTTPRWWGVIGGVQWVLTAAMVVGLLWLAVNAAVVWFGLPKLPAVHLGSLELPTWLALGGGIVGLALAWIGRVVSAVGAKRRATRARVLLDESAQEVAFDRVIEPLNDELGRMRHTRELCQQLSAARKR